MLGAVLSVRGRETVIEVWFDFQDNQTVKNSIFDKINIVAKPDFNQKLYFKATDAILKDNSTVKNAEKYSNKMRKYTVY